MEQPISLGEQLDREISRVQQIINDNNEGRARESLKSLLAIERVLNHARTVREQGDAVAVYNALQAMKGIS